MLRVTGPLVSGAGICSQAVWAPLHHVTKMNRNQAVLASGFLP